MNNNENGDDDNTNILLLILFLGLIFILYLFFGDKKGGGGGGGGGGTLTTPCESPVLVLPEESPTVPGGGCPLNGPPYTYCSTDTIDKIYIVESCPASKRLVTKLINEGKLTGEDDPKIVRCCKKPDLCPGIRKYPSVTCKADPLLIYEGYCP